MATQDDIEANAEYISEGDFLVEVPGGPSENNYSNIPLIVQVV
jgi:biotin carboxylase